MRPETEIEFGAYKAIVMRLSLVLMCTIFALSNLFILSAFLLAVWYLGIDTEAALTAITSFYDQHVLLSNFVSFGAAFGGSLLTILVVYIWVFRRLYSFTILQYILKDIPR
jgi:hypothetical protein